MVPTLCINVEAEITVCSSQLSEEYNSFHNYESKKSE